MDTKALRQKILDLAIRGQLVPQDPNDEPASVLLDRIRAEKQKMVKEGKLKAKDIKNDSVIFVGEDNLHYEKFANGSVRCIEDEIPFDLPEGWAWSRIKNIASIGTGATPLKSNTEYYVGGKISWITSAATCDNIIKSATDYITELAVQETNCQIYPVGTLVVAMYGEGKTRGQISELGIAACTNQACAAIQVWGGNAGVSQLVKMFFSYNYENIRMKAKGGQQPNLNQSIIAETLIPIPPENEIMRLLDFSHTCLNEIQVITENKERTFQLANQARTKILDLAIRGKLVPQDPNDEPASVLLERIRAEKEELIKQGKIKRDKKESVIFRGEDNSYYEKVGSEVCCIDAEIPFEVPATWVWTRLESCCIKEIRRGKAPKYVDKSGVLVFAQKCNTKHNGIDIGLSLYLDVTTLGRYPDDEYMQDGDVVINSTGTGTLGRVGLYRVTDNIAGLPIVPDSHVTIIRCSSSIQGFYLYAFLKAHQEELEKKGEGSTNQKELKPLTLKEMLIALPPVSEQQRIEDTISIAFSHISTVEKSLS